MERPDDRRLRACGARGRRGRPGRVGVSRRRAPGRVVHPRSHVERGLRGRCCGAIAAGEASIEAYAEDYAYLIFGLLELFQADPDPCAGSSGPRCSSAGRTSCSGTMSAGGWFSTTGTRSERAAADERGLRRRRADGQLGVGAEPARALASARGATVDRADRADAQVFRDAPRADGPRRADDGGRAVRCTCRACARS